jgi:CDP-diacylglycerol--serine O-phosphatidyltransferase
MFSIPNLFTAANLLCGVFAIILALAGRIDLAPFAIFAGLLFDFFDGFLARKLKISGEMGKQLDSLADMITFGVAPGVIMMVVLVLSIYMDESVQVETFQEHAHFELNTWFNAVFYGVPNHMDASVKYLPFLALFIPFMSMFRLAKFNLDTRQSDSFIGVPTPLNTLFFMFFPLVLLVDFETWKNGESFHLIIFNSYFLVGLIVIMSLLLVAELPLLALKIKSFAWKENQFRYIFIFLCVVFIPIFLVWSIPLIVFLYLIISLIENSFKKKKQHEV